MDVTIISNTRVERIKMMYTVVRTIYNFLLYKVNLEAPEWG